MSTALEGIKAEVKMYDKLCFLSGAISIAIDINAFILDNQDDVSEEFLQKYLEHYSNLRKNLLKEVELYEEVRKLEGKNED